VSDRNQLVCDEVSSSTRRFWSQRHPAKTQIRFRFNLATNQHILFRYTSTQSAISVT